MQSAVAELELELAPGERLLWSDKPLQGVRFTPADLFLVPFGIVWLAFSLGFETMALRTAPREGGAMSIALAVFGLPFVLLGLYLLAGRFWLDARSRARTAYGITDRRVLTVTRGRTRRVRGLDLDQIRDVETVERADGSGTLRVLGAPDGAYIKAGREQRFPATAGLAFSFLPKVREAREVLERARAEKPV